MSAKEEEEDEKKEKKKEEMLRPPLSTLAWLTFVSCTMMIAGFHVSGLIKCLTDLARPVRAHTL